MEVILKYLYSQIYTKEIPDEISLGISIIGCPIHCPECHSKHIWDINSNNIGKELTYNELIKIFYPNHKLISCLLFFGGEWEDSLYSILKSFKSKFNHKIGLYSGLELSSILEQSSSILHMLNYLKVGPYKSEYGGLDNPNTNQRMYRLEEGKIIEDITYKFWNLKE